jgi:hypothetical protein
LNIESRAPQAGTIEHQNRRSWFPFLIAPITLTGTYLGLGIFPNVLRQRLANVIRFLEPTLCVASHETLVSASVDQFAFAVMFLFSHFISSAELF